MQSLLTEYREIRHAHFFAGLGGGAKGFNRGHARVGNMQARFRYIGGIDSNPAAVRDFKRLTGVEGTLLDLFDLEQYRAFHGSEPPVGWREANVEDVRKAFHYETPHILFLSPPCKGFSSLLPERLSKSVKYQALNRLVTRGLFLALEAYKDDLPELILMENVPRITIRGRWLLDQITALMNHYGYAVAETAHDCGELGGLAETRKRFLLVARNVAKVPPFLYEPEKKPLRTVGEVLSRAPLPGDPRGGPMHRLPMLTWKTWVRLAFVEAGGDWRSLNKLNIVDGQVADYALVHEPQRNDFLGVVGWGQTSGTVTGDARPSKGKFAVADPRTGYPEGRHTAVFSVADWDDQSRTVTGADHVTGGALSVADPRPGRGYSARPGPLGVRRWDEVSGVVAGSTNPTNGAFSIADPRFEGAAFGQFGVREWDKPAATVTGQQSPGQGPISIADPRRPSGPGCAHFNNIFRVVEWNDVSPAVTGGGGPSAGGLCVGDPRFQHAQGVFSGKYSVQAWDGPSTTITGSDRVGSGALCVADPRPAAQKQQGDSYLTHGNYGVVGWNQPTGAISAAACLDNGRWSVADPRGIDGIDPGPAYENNLTLPEPNEKCHVLTSSPA